MAQHSRIRLDTEADGFSIPWLGDTQLRMPIRTADTAGACSTQLNTIPPGYENPPHCHGREDEVFYVIDGGVELSLGGERVRLNAGELALAPRGVPHQLRNPYDEPASLFVLLTPGNIEEAFVEASRDLDQVGEAFSRVGVVMLDSFDPGFVHPEVDRDRVPAAHIVRPESSPRVWMAGDTYTVLLPGEAVEQRCAIVHFDIPPGGGPIPHVHHRDGEAFVVLDGEVTLYADGEVLTAKPGDVAVLPRGLPHGFKNRSDRPAQMLAVVNPSGFERMLREVGRPAVAGQSPPPIDEAEKQRLRAIAPKYGVEIRPDIDFH